MQVVVLKLPQGGAQSCVFDADITELHQYSIPRHDRSGVPVAADIDRHTVFSSNRRFAGLYRVT
jgi:hypothetical protein